MVTYSSYANMFEGFQPKDMDDKWAVIVDDPDAQGNTVVRVIRSWLSEEFFTLTIEAGNFGNTEVEEWAKIVDISWTPNFFQSRVIDEAEAKRWAKSMLKGCMGCEFKDWIIYTSD
jgi:hypothetical protein